MASAIRQLAGMGGDVRKIAALLKKKAPPGHILAYITPQEAQLLKARGGSGKEHENTGILSFEEGDFDSTGLDTGETIPYQTEQVSDLYAPGKTMGDVTTFMPAGDVISGEAPQGGGFAASTGEGLQLGKSTPGGAGLGLQGRSFEGIQATPTIETPSLTSGGRPDYDITQKSLGLGAIDEARGTGTAKPGLSKDTMAKLGVAGVGGLIGGLQARRAASQGQASKQEMAALAQPYATKGAELRGAAERGELTPQAQRAVQAARAQIAQGAERRGGVGAQQAEAQIQALTQNLLQQQYDLGLKLSGISDNIMMGAIKTGLQADQYANQLTASYFNNIARTMYGTPTVRE